MSARLDTLPPEVLSRIAVFLPLTRDVVRLSLCSSHLNESLSDDMVFKARLRECPPSDARLTGPARPFAWLDQCQSVVVPQLTALLEVVRPPSLQPWPPSSQPWLPSSPPWMSSWRPQPPLPKDRLTIEEADFGAMVAHSLKTLLSWHSRNFANALQLYAFDLLIHPRIWMWWSRRSGFQLSAGTSELLGPRLNQFLIRLGSLASSFLLLFLLADDAASIDTKQRVRQASIHFAPNLQSIHSSDVNVDHQTTVRLGYDLLVALALRSYCIRPDCASPFVARVPAWPRPQLVGAPIINLFPSTSQALPSLQPVDVAAVNEVWHGYCFREGARAPIEPPMNMLLTIVHSAGNGGIRVNGRGDDSGGIFTLEGRLSGWPRFAATHVRGPEQQDWFGFWVEHRLGIVAAWKGLGRPVGGALWIWPCPVRRGLPGAPAVCRACATTPGWTPQA